MNAFILLLCPTFSRVRSTVAKEHFTGRCLFVCSLNNIRSGAVNESVSHVTKLPHTPNDNRHEKMLQILNHGENAYDRLLIIFVNYTS